MILTSLRQLDLSLEEIGECLDNPRFSPLQVIELHIRRLKEQVDMQQRLCGRFSAIAKGLRAMEDVSVDELIWTIEEIKMAENTFTPEQLEYIKERGRIVGEQRIKEVDAERPVLTNEVRAELDKRSDRRSAGARAGPPLEGPCQRVYRRQQRDRGSAAPPLRRGPHLWPPRCGPRMGEYMTYINQALAAS